MQKRNAGLGKTDVATWGDGVDVCTGPETRVQLEKHRGMGPVRGEGIRSARPHRSRCLTPLIATREAGPASTPVCTLCCGKPALTPPGDGFTSGWGRTPRRSQLASLELLRLALPLTSVHPTYPCLTGKTGSFPSCSRARSGSRCVHWRLMNVFADEAPEGASSTGWRPNPRRLMPAPRSIVASKPLHPLTRNGPIP